MLSIIRTGLKVANKQISAISNNLANAGTTGFKRSSANFYDIMAPSSEARPELAIGQGARMQGMRQDFRQGAFRTTNAVLDLAIKGNSFFVHQGKTGEAAMLFTRNGALQMDNQGRIVSSDGRFLLGRDQAPIQVPLTVADGDGRQLTATSIDIANNGQIKVTYGNNLVVQAGQIMLARFVNNEGLQIRGNGLYTASDKSGPPIFGQAGNLLYGEIYSGALEASNTDVTEELVALINAQQAFSGNSRLMQSEAEIVKRFTSG